MKSIPFFLGLIFVILFSIGCANPGIVKVAPNTYLLSRVDHAGAFGNAAAMKADVIREANEFAESQGKIAIPVYLNETPAWPTHFATIDYQFRLVDKSDPEAQRAYIIPQPNATTEKKDIYSELIKLDDLRKRGILSEAEFEAQKKKLLDSK
jgi:hypothetical protein